MPAPGHARVALISPIEDDLPVQVSAYKAWMPRYGSVAVAQALKDAGYEVRFFCEHSGSIVDWDYVLSCEYVCFSLMTFSAPRGFRYADRVRSGSEALVIMGGCHASVAPEDCLDHADYVVRNEGEASLIDLLRILDHGGDASALPGISLKVGEAFRHNPDRQFIQDLGNPVDLSLIEGFPPNTLRRFLLEALGRRRVPRISLPVAQASRGCVHQCKFCMVKHELGSRHRARPPEVVVAETKRALEFLRSRTVFFVDNDFTHDTDHAVAILEPLIDAYDGRLSVYFFSRVSLAKKSRLLAVLRRVRSVYVGVGFESTNDLTLDQFAKGQSMVGFADAVATLHEHGLNIHGLFIFGSDADTVASLDDTVRFAIRSSLYTVGFSALYDIPGKERTLGLPQLIPDHRFIHRDWRLFTGHFVVHFPSRIRPSQLQRMIIDGQRRFFRANRSTFFQYFPVYAASEPYIRYLEEQEHGLYDQNDRLIEERLGARSYEDLPRFVPLSASRRIQAREIVEFIARNATRAKSWRMLGENFGLAPRPRGEPPFSGHLDTLQP